MPQVRHFGLMCESFSFEPDLLQQKGSLDLRTSCASDSTHAVYMASVAQAAKRAARIWYSSGVQYCWVWKAAEDYSIPDAEFQLPVLNQFYRDPN